MVVKKSNLNEQNFKVYWKTRMEDGGWRMEDGGWRIENKGSEIEDQLKKNENKINR